MFVVPRKVTVIDASFIVNILHFSNAIFFFPVVNVKFPTGLWFLFFPCDK